MVSQNQRTPFASQQPVPPSAPSQVSGVPPELLDEVELVDDDTLLLLDEVDVALLLDAVALPPLPDAIAPPPPDDVLPPVRAQASAQRDWRHPANATKGGSVLHVSSGDSSPTQFTQAESSLQSSASVQQSAERQALQVASLNETSQLAGAPPLPPVPPPPLPLEPTAIWMGELVAQAQASASASATARSETRAMPRMGRRMTLAAGDAQPNVWWTASTLFPSGSRANAP
jgi:hypothetical protein